ncbi:hypothetical protein [Pusillimonas sp. ANT_WB101]|uniref:hypothetical protein n=1 Tax=Pusillimonas sp. ANT_WB101 TaxID=2597356 RepID=UPI0011ECD587|nr:hypothetical protein [Pusillimonas sp. ANT_WB101]KAA0889905.1 hypothetical protein FQ179_16230 [Pusillimonas sp. ANT_WB101]
MNTTARLPAHGRYAGAVVLLGALSACANMANTLPGTSLADVEAKFGRPTLTCPAPNDALRVVWSQQPMGQYAWGTVADRAGNTNHITQLLTDQHFELLAKGTWTPQQVRCEFGPPAEIATVGLPSVTQIVWSYRYRQAGAWNSLMYVYFGQDGQKVTRFHPGPDPMFDVDSFPWF